MKRKPFFDKDEMTLRRPSPAWSREDLLNQEGMFALKDVAGLLQIKSLDIKNKVQALHDEGISAWDEIGVRKLLSHWVIRMSLFAPYYRKNLTPQYRVVLPEWDRETLLQQKGMFRLADVCDKLGFDLNKVRYRIKKETKQVPASKDPGGQFVVDMAVFSTWLQQQSNLQLHPQPIENEASSPA